MEARDREETKKFSLLLGVGLDARDGHYRRTKGESFLLVGGSEETHEIMQEKAVHLTEELARRGKRLEDVDDIEELRDIARDAGL